METVKYRGRMPADRGCSAFCFHNNRSVLYVHVGTFSVWILTPNVKNKYRCSPTSIRNVLSWTLHSKRLKLPLRGRGWFRRSKKHSNFVWFNQMARSFIWKLTIAALVIPKITVIRAYNIFQCPTILFSISMQQWISNFSGGMYFLNSKILSKNGTSSS